MENGENASDAVCARCQKHLKGIRLSEIREGHLACEPCGAAWDILLKNVTQAFFRSTPSSA
ncbi:MAG: hypothetical protein V3U45_03840 [bacterium]